MQTVYFDGLRFSRNNKNCYFRNAKTGERLHRYVWKYYNGDIPDGYDIHHIDGDKGNNDISNLQLLSKYDHQILHRKQLTDEQRAWRRNNLNTNARPKAVEWHKSSNGSAWHKEHIKQQHENGAFNRELICTECGKKYVGKVFKSGGNTFCSNNCKARYLRHKRSTDNSDVRICAVCGNEFSCSHWSDRCTCSKSCTNRLNWKNRKLRNESKENS